MVKREETTVLTPRQIEIICLRVWVPRKLCWHYEEHVLLLDTFKFCIFCAMIVSTMIENPFQSHRLSHHLRRIRVDSSNLNKVTSVDRERQSPLETRKKPCMTSKPLKTVHFARQTTSYECPEALFKEDIEKFWYSEEDYEAFKQSSLKIARDIRRNGAHQTRGIEDALEQSKCYAIEMQDHCELEKLLETLAPPSKVSARQNTELCCDFPLFVKILF